MDVHRGPRLECASARLDHKGPWVLLLGPIHLLHPPRVAHLDLGDVLEGEGENSLLVHLRRPEPNPGLEDVWLRRDTPLGVAADAPHKQLPLLGLPSVLICGLRLNVHDLLQLLTGPHKRRISLHRRGRRLLLLQPQPLLLLRFCLLRKPCLLLLPLTLQAFLLLFIPLATLLALLVVLATSLLALGRLVLLLGRLITSRCRCRHRRRLACHLRLHKGLRLFCDPLHALHTVVPIPLAPRLHIADRLVSHLQRGRLVGLGLLCCEAHADVLHRVGLQMAHQRAHRELSGRQAPLKAHHLRHMVDEHEGPAFLGVYLAVTKAEHILRICVDLTECQQVAEALSNNHDEGVLEAVFRDNEVQLCLIELRLLGCEVHAVRLLLVGLQLDLLVAVRERERIRVGEIEANRGWQVAGVANLHPADRLLPHNGAGEHQLVACGGRGRGPSSGLARLRTSLGVGALSPLAVVLHGNLPFHLGGEPLGWVGQFDQDLGQGPVPTNLEAQLLALGLATVVHHPLEHSVVGRQGLGPEPHVDVAVLVRGDLQDLVPPDVERLGTGLGVLGLTARLDADVDCAWDLVWVHEL
mmetsp:Transcript_118561/g.206426  ORF Transcript_118561/g.206426 Transcript_118561/m.206426 type:complete len:581 (-) Transcript_118561:8649-10391(-)